MSSSLELTPSRAGIPLLSRLTSVADGRIVPGLGIPCTRLCTLRLAGPISDDCFFAAELSVCSPLFASCNSRYAPLSVPSS